VAKSGGRRYARDNRGRFASTGATARGGRLKTAGGNKRATVTVKAKGGGNGTIAKPKGLKPGTLKPKPVAKPAPVAKAKTRLPRTAGTVAKPKGLKPGTLKPKTTARSGKGKAPATKLPGVNSDQYKYNAAGYLATPKERQRMRGRDRAREKNAALASAQTAGTLRAQRRAADSLLTGRIETRAFSSTASLAKSAHDRRAKRAGENFSRTSIANLRQSTALTQKAVQIQQKAAERKAAGKPITAAMQRQHAEIVSKINKLNKSEQTARKALDVLQQQKNTMEGRIRGNRRYL